MTLDQGSSPSLSFNPLSFEHRGWQVPEMRLAYWEGKTCNYCVIIPVINEGQRITSLLHRMQQQKIAELCDIIIVDGGSTDGSLEHSALKQLNVRGLIIKTGAGRLSAQLRCAYAFALEQGYEGIVTIDGNDKDDPEGIPRFVAALQSGVDFVQASRYLPGGIGENTPRSRDLAIRFLHAPALSLSSGFRWTDTTQGFRAYSRKLLVDAQIAPFREIFSDYELLAYLSHRAPQLGYRCQEIATIRRYPKGEVPTKISTFRGNWRVFQTLALACLGRYNVKAGEAIHPCHRKQATLILLICSFGFLFGILTFYPGWMSPDSFAQYEDATVDSYSDWQPVLMARVWRAFDGVYAGPAPMLLLHFLLYWWAWGTLAWGGRRALGWVALLIPIIGFWPGLFLPLGQIWKDISFATATFLSWAFLYRAHVEKRRLALSELAVIFLCCVYAIGVKTNGLVVMPFLWAFVVKLNFPSPVRWRSVIFAALFIPLLAAFTSDILVPDSKVRKSSPLQYTQTYDLLALSVKTGKVLLPPYVTEKVGSSLEDLRTLYYPGGNNLLFYHTGGGVFTVDRELLGDLQVKWLRAIQTYPLHYLSHRWSNFEALLRWGQTVPAYVVDPTIGPNQYGFVFTPNKFSEALAGLRSSAPWMFFPWIYCLTLLLSAAIVLYYSPSHRFLTACFSASALSFVLPHLFIGPAADYRYLYYAYFCAMTLLFFSCCIVCYRLGVALGLVSPKRLMAAAGTSR